MTHRALQPKPRRLSICHRHPAEPVTGFCASCLRERLAGLDSPAHPEVSSSITVPDIIGSSSGAGGGVDGACGRSGANDAPRQELRRCKSYAAGKCGAYAGASEPRRKSYDVRARSTLGHLFDVDDEEKGLGRRTEVESKNLGFSGLTRSVAEIRDKIRVSEDVSGANGNVRQQRDEEFEEDLKTMKEHIELEWQSRRHKVRDFKHIAESFWGAASLFSQKLRKWKLKQRMRKPSGCGESRSSGGDLTPGDKQNGRQFRETQSEVGDYGYGRRSCDTDPRFSVDAARMSLDDPRFCFDEPRASWDGYMIARTIPRLAPMLSVIENAMMPLPLMNKVGVGVSIEEQMNPINEDETTSGGSAQTRDYCSDSSSSQRQNSFDCSSSGKSSNKKTVTLEVDKMKSLSNDKVSNMESAVANTDTKDIDFGSVKYDNSGRFESSGKVAIPIAGGGIQNGGKKLGKWRKAWNILGFMHRSHDIKYEVPEGNAIGCPLGDCLEKQNGDADGVADEASSGKFVQIGSCSSSSYKMKGSFHRSTSVAESRSYVVKSREEPALEQNRSARYSPSHFDNGLLRFHLTPSWTSRSKSGRSRRKNSLSSANSVLRMS